MHHDPTELGAEEIRASDQWSADKPFAARSETSQPRPVSVTLNVKPLYDLAPIPTSRTF